MTLPTPDPAFDWTAEPWGHGLRCTPLAQYAQHLFTTRQLQLRRPQHETGGDAANSSPAWQTYLAAWTQAAASVGAGLEQVLRVHQRHGAVVRSVRREEITPTSAAERPDGDALISNATGFVLAVQVADCVPILIADKKTRAVAAVHAGWRGTCAGVTTATIDALTREFGSAPHDLCAAFGPSIGPCCYEVGQGVLDEFRLSGVPEHVLERWFRETEAGSLRLDLQIANRDQLAAAGVAEKEIYLCGLCTQTHRDVFASYRADGERAGRMAALIAAP